MMDPAFLLIVVLTTVLTRPLYADVPRCDRNNPDFSQSPYCFPEDYNMDIVPHSDGPLHVNVDIFVFEVNKCQTFPYFSKVVRGVFSVKIPSN